MQKGYKFNNSSREISFNDYKKPMPWMNYFSNGTCKTLGGE